MNNHVLPTNHHEWRGVIVTLGWGSIDAWAEAHSHNPDTAHSTIRRWAGRTGTPRGDKSAAVMRDLEATLRERRRPKKKRGQGNKAKSA